MPEQENQSSNKEASQAVETKPAAAADTTAVAPSTQETTTAAETTLTETPPVVTTTDKPESRESIKEEGDGTSFDDFKLAMSGVAIPPKEGVKSKVDVETKPQEELKDKTPPQDTSNKPVAREMAEFAPEEQTHLKRMSNEAFAWVKPQLLERKRLSNVLAEKDKQIADLKVGKVTIPDSYFEHPQAFVLTPQFSKAANELQLASRVEEHWKEQFAKIRRGEEWVSAESIDVNGNITVSKPQPADANSEARVISLINHSAKQLQDKQRTLNDIQVNFSNRHNEATNILKQVEKEQFSIYDDPKHVMQPLMKQLKEAIPAEFRSSPLSGLLVKVSTAMLQFKKAYEDEKKSHDELKKSGVKTVTTNANGNPTEKDLTASGTSTKTNSSAPTLGENFDDFENYRKGL